MYYISKKNRDGKQGIGVPYASPGIVECIREFSGPRCPLFMLRLVKEAKENGSLDGSFRLPLAIGGLYVIGSAKVARQIMMDPTTDKVPQFYDPYNSVTSSQACIFTSMNSEYQTMVRKCTRHAFSNKEVGRMTSICRSITDKWIDETAIPWAKSGTSFDPSEEMIKVVMKVICLAGFEYEISDEEDTQFVHNMEVCLRESLRQASNPVRKMFSPFIKACQEMNKSAREISEFVAKVLDTYRKNPTKSSATTLIKLIDSNDKFLSDQERIGEIIIYLLGGHDTTGFTLSTTLLMVGKHPHICNKLRSELLKVPPESWDTECDYLKFVIKESMRLYPVAAINGFRKVGKDFVTEDGRIIPKGSSCVILNTAFGRDERYFENPEDFNPDRWYNATEEMKGAIMNFAAGSRGCVGQVLAMAKLNTIIPRIVTEFALELAKEGEFDYFLTWKIVDAQLILKKL